MNGETRNGDEWSERKRRKGEKEGVQVCVCGSMPVCEISPSLSPPPPYLSVAQAQWVGELVRWTDIIAHISDLQAIFSPYFPSVIHTARTSHDTPRCDMLVLFSPIQSVLVCVCPL